MPLVESRYAQALIDISSQNGLLDEYRKEFEEILSIYKEDPEFRQFLLNPSIKSGIKKDLANKVFEGKIKAELLHFLSLLIDKNRFKLLEGIFHEFCRLADELENILRIEIISAEPLDKSQTDQIIEKYRAACGASGIRADVKVDASLIGGVMVKIGDKVIDGTIKGRLAHLRESVMEA